MLLKALKCPHCGAPLKSKVKDHMLLCPSCGRISLFSEGDVGQVDFRIAKPADKKPDETLVYVPFWIVNATLDVHREDISGGKIRRAIRDERQMRGTRDFYVCASDQIPEEYSRVWNMDLTLDQPTFETIDAFKDGKREAMSVDRDVAGNNAEFLFIRYETEIPGTLQELDYDFTVNSTKVLYLPAFKKDNNYKLGI
jgi:NADH pyrophosphatase zinc ribbon domain.